MILFKIQGHLPFANLNDQVSKTLLEFGCQIFFADYR